MRGVLARYRGLAGLLLLLGAGTPVHAQTDSLQSGGLVLAISQDRGRLELPGGGALSLKLPEWAEVSSLAALDRGGWAVAGSTRGEDGRRRLFFVFGDRSGSRPVPEPPGQRGLERREAVLLVDDGRLEGLAWLEGDGDRSLSVRAAAWDGQAWRTPEPISIPGPGSQLALSGAVLADGSWLLAWTAFDGQDDEVVWSRRTAEGWSPVRPMSDNAVPDITPALAVSGKGALLAWSRFDGQSYRLHLARFADGRWLDERAAAPAGTLLPSFQETEDGLYLLYRTARPKGWSVQELDRIGKTLRQIDVGSDPPERPVIAGGSRLRLRWLSREREKAQ